jgi:hypothetical protein
MHRQVEVFSSISWFWPTLIAFIMLVFIGLIAYAIFRSRIKDDPSAKILEEEKEMAEIWCPNLLAETEQLRAEVKQLKNYMVKQNADVSQNP